MLPRWWTAWLTRDTSLPVVAMQISVKRAGGVSDPVGKEGLAYVTANMLAEGAGAYTSAQFHEMLELYAIQLDVSSGRDTMDVEMEALSEHTDKAFELVGAMLTQPRFDQTDIDRIRAEHLSDLTQLEESPGYRLNTAFYQKAFAGHPYSHSPYGSASSITALARRDLQGFAKAHLAKDQLIISVSGDIDAVTLKRLLHTHLAGLPAHATLPASPDHAHLHNQPEPVQVTMAIPQTSIRIAMPGIARKDERFYAAFVMNYMLGGGSLSSRLAHEIRKQRGLTYSIASDLDMQDYAEWVSIDFATKAESAKEALDTALATVDKAATEGFSESELQAAKDYLTGAFPLSVESNAQRVNYLTVMQQYQLGKDYLQERNGLITSVTLQQVNDVAKALLSPDKRLVILTGETPHAK
jgi:zinc protease